MPRLLWESQQNSLVYMGMVSRGNPPDNEPNQSLAAPSNKKLRLEPILPASALTGYNPPCELNWAVTYVRMQSIRTSSNFCFLCFTCLRALDIMAPYATCINGSVDLYPAIYRGDQKQPRNFLIP
jgi:hypothetical protein